MPTSIISRINHTWVGITDLWREIVRDNADRSLLTRAESNAIKGILILLVVLGHNKYVMAGGMSNVFLYSFHVYAFYYLPFLYDFRKMEWGGFFKKNLKRLYVPYTVFFCLVALSAWARGFRPGVINILEAYVCGSQNFLHSTFGFGSFLWFLPTMLSVLTFRQIYYRLGFTGRNIMLVLSGVCLCGYAYLWSWYIPLWWYTPFCITVGLGMVLPAVCLRSVCMKADPRILLLCFFFLMVAVIIFYPVAHEYSYTYLTLNRLICPLVIFSTLLTLRSRLSQSRIAVELGVGSLVIYLTHQFIYNACYAVASHFQVGIYGGLVMFIIALGGGYLISKIKFVRYVFPK